MKKVLVAVSSAWLLMAPMVFAESSETSETLTATSLPLDRIYYPRDQARAVVVLLSGEEGWSTAETSIAGTLSDKGVVTVGVDLPAYYRALALEERSCLYLVSDIERISKQLHRLAAIETYRPPVVAGLGEGATLALAIAAQTPVSTISATIAVDPGSVVPLENPLCTPAPKTPSSDGIAYGLTKGPLPDPVTIALTHAASAVGRRHAARLQASHPDVAVVQAKGSPAAVLSDALNAVSASLAGANVALDLPLVELPADAGHDVFAIIYSGDGGWRDIDRKLGFFLQQAGVPVVGVDSLRYFWSEKTPQQTATDLTAIIKAYRKRYGVSQVALVGYSFGADILPAAFAKLEDDIRDDVKLVSLLALSRSADFEIAVTGWLGMSGEGKYGDPVDDLVKAMPAGKLQCVYGVAETESGCLALGTLERQGAEIIQRPGGHHFDGKYELIADHILDRLRQRVASNP
ncbi:virulence factor family protein [Agrobacterium sp. ES01]|uniref:virulence factor family protein n=1 Tax=Agrobacterium sp. ES01 TaxID=3420714 RepID=UPI003D0E138E